MATSACACVVISRKKRRADKPICQKELFKQHAGRLIFYSQKIGVSLFQRVTQDVTYLHHRLVNEYYKLYGVYSTPQRSLDYKS